MRCTLKMDEIILKTMRFILNIDEIELTTVRFLLKKMVYTLKIGAFLQNFFVNTPICCPSRTEFFSGR